MYLTPPYLSGTIHITPTLPINYNFTFSFGNHVVFGLQQGRNTHIVKLSISEMESNPHILKSVPSKAATINEVVKAGVVFDEKFEYGIFFSTENPQKLYNSYQIRLKSMRIMPGFKRHLSVSADFVFGVVRGPRIHRILIGSNDGRSLIIDPHIWFTLATKISISFAVVVSSLCLLFVFLLPPVIYYYSKNKRREKTMDELNYRLLEFEKPIDPNNSFVRNPLNKSYIIPFEKIKFLKRLGEGASGVVFVGMWNKTKVAIKQMKTINDESKIMQEISILSSIRHPNIIMFCGLSVDNDDSKYIITQFAEKGNLDNLIHQVDNKNQTMTFDEKLNILLGIGRGMAYLHAMIPPIIHRDLKPQNILIDSDGPKICDFGMSKFAVNTQMTGITLGTQEYISPEVIMQNSEYDEKCDVFSFAIIMHEIFFMQRPYQPLHLNKRADAYIPPHDNIFSFGFKVVNGERPEIPFTNDDVTTMEKWFNACHKNPNFNPEAVRRYFSLCRKCWSREASDRPAYETICEILEELIGDK
jgi:hypothetical protein